MLGNILKPKAVKENVQIDMNNMELKGDIIDIGMDNYGVIYKLCKDTEDEVALEYVVEEEKQLIEGQYYDTAVLFFTLSKLGGFTSRKRLLNELCTYLKETSELVIWDINKRANTVMDLRLEVLLPRSEIKSIRIREKNLLKKFNLEQIRHLVIDYFDIIEEKEMNNIIFLRARRKGRNTNESGTCST